MQIKCTKCQKVIEIAAGKLPKDKEKAMVKCPACQQVLVFNIPASLRQVVENSEKTIVDFGNKKNLRPRLVQLSNSTEYLLKTGKNIIGRDAGISIPGDRYISHKHCMIEVMEQFGEIQCIITDDGSISEKGEPSTNGTFYNDQRLTRYDKLFLNNEDKIRIGHTDFIFKTE
ncbi:MAG: zinc-ribbon domain-containing protein [Bacteroidales bacterium]|nr:zinc-ribbon domain-containing protein [Bacteroidales bacterium]